MKSMDQIRAEEAWNMVKGTNKEYANLAKAAPALIMDNGLMQTLAFFENKKGAATNLGEHIRTWVWKKLNPEKRFENVKFEEFMGWLIEKDSDCYMQATEEALEVLRWIRQFASAVTTTDKNE